MKNGTNIYELFQKQAERLLLIHYNHQEMIPESVQEEKLQASKKILPFETFVFVINNRTFQVDSAFGICNLLGYPDNTFTLKKFFSIIHPAYNAVLLINRYELLETLMKGERNIHFSAPIFIANIALKHFNGEYILFKWMASPFQVDSRNAMLSCFNEFILISSFRNETCNMRIVNENGKAVEWYNELSNKIKKRFKEYSFFSEKEIYILIYYSANPSCTNSSAAAHLNLKTSSVITYNKRILKKAVKLFQRHFKTAHDVADYLYQEKLI